MSRSNRYSPELRERAMRMVMENRVGCLHCYLEALRYVPEKTQDLASKDPDRCRLSPRSHIR
jgi:hypothetical protein